MEISGVQDYLEQEVVVHQGPELSPGDHLVPFALTLPPNLPSSFIGKHGSVVYHLQASMVRDWKFDNEVKANILVDGLLDLNLLPAAKQRGLHDAHCASSWL